MFSNCRHFRFIFAVVPLLCLVTSAHAQNGWLGFRNDTTLTLIVQETVPAGSSSRPGKPQKIFANETVRETTHKGGQRTFTIADATRADKPLFTGRLAGPAANENMLYVIKSDGKGGLSVEAVSSPVASKPPKR
jgi:hypothetical protein